MREKLAKRIMLALATLSLSLAVVSSCGWSDSPNSAENGPAPGSKSNPRDVKEDFGGTEYEEWIKMTDGYLLQCVRAASGAMDCNWAAYNALKTGGTAVPR